MRIYIIIMTGSRSAARGRSELNGARLQSLRTRSYAQRHSAASGCWRCGMLCPVSKKRKKVGDCETPIHQLWSAIEALAEPEPRSTRGDPQSRTRSSRCCGDPKASPGGIILVDEYNDPPWPGCKLAVDEFLADKKVKPMPVAMDNYQKYFVQR